MSTACLEIAAVRPVVSPRHPGGSRTRILLSSVFGPYAQDDDYGSRAMNPMELYHNQVTRTQGPFSLRMFHRSWGLMLIQANVQAPCTVLDFPTLDRFVEELRRHTYDIVGISSIVSNQLKVRKMCELVRRYQPHAKIVVGGHIANMPDLDERIDADYIVRGDGVRWMRQFLGEDTEQPIRHPLIVSGHGCRSAGVSLSSNPEDIAATLIPSVGCPLGCNFCSTSAMFGGKGRFVDFYHTGDELFEVMCQLEQSMGVKAFFAMDENFLFHRRRALRLLELMQQHDKAWALYVFSSANVLRSYSLEQLIGLGISWVWMGIEGENSRYAKLNGIDTLALVRQLQSHGIRILGSTIIGLENHTPENIDQVIAHAVRHDTDFHQFMLYTPLPGTPAGRQRLQFLEAPRGPTRPVKLGRGEHLVSRIRPCRTWHPGQRNVCQLVRHERAPRFRRVSLADDGELGLGARVPAHLCSASRDGRTDPGGTGAETRTGQEIQSGLRHHGIPGGFAAGHELAHAARQHRARPAGI